MAPRVTTHTAIPCAANEGAACDAVVRWQFERPNGHDMTQTVQLCEACGHGVSMPALGDVTFLYEGRGTQDYQPTNRGLSRWIKEIAFRKSARRLLKDLGRKPGSVLDYGCGSGQFTRILGEQLPKGIVVGCDFFGEPPAELTGRPYVGYAELARTPQEYDVVTALHVLEHDENPTALLAVLSGLVRKGGTLMIEVPNVECPWARIFGTWWDAWYMPYHRHHYSRRSLCAAIKRAGLEVTACHDVTVPTMGRTLANICGKPNTLWFLLAGIILHPVQVIVERWSGEGSALRIFAQKP